MTRRNDRGGSGLLGFLFFLAIVIFIGFRIGKLYFDNSTIENEIAVVGDNALAARAGNPKADVLKQLAVYDVTIDPQDIKVEYNDRGDRVTIGFSYVRMADFMVYKHPMRFKIDVQREGGRGMGVVQSVQEGLEDSQNASAGRWKSAAENVNIPPPAEP